ncbi:hypothetical protein RPIT_07445 [Tessaracoccus flavus]|uniref:Orc1-like AAA ATPase domain-containing protein n=2 Tax=Tessaracoccus flavus TaxID=1610493 RepID=A0A1Q2CEX9_9ACTN|nr:hypothetical protein RPIT_07445 [Tessaracoccus flavus]
MTEMSYRVEQVFTPTSQAVLNFVPRAGLDAAVKDALSTPGKQIVVYGESGSGKTTLLRQCVKSYHAGWITTSCHAETTFSDLLLDAFDQLDLYYAESHGSATKQAFGTTLEAQFLQAKSAVQASLEESATTGHKRIVVPQISPQRLAKWMGEKDLCWIIEDFHKVREVEKKALAQAFKIFSDMAMDYPAVRIVAIGATDSAREVVAYENEMRNRVAEIHVPLMDIGELRGILRGGDSLLNIDSSQISHDIVNFSSGLASVTHHLALNACRAAKIRSTQAIKKRLLEAELQSAVLTYIAESSDTLKARYELALKRERERKYHNTELIIRALARGPQEGLSHAQVLADIRRENPEYPSSNVTLYLQKLQSEDRGALIRRTSAGLFRFIDPLFHSYARARMNPELAAPGSGWSAAFSAVIREAVAMIAIR